jgi:hypothetical protein
MMKEKKFGKIRENRQITWHKQAKARLGSGCITVMDRSSSAGTRA